MYLITLQKRSLILIAIISACFACNKPNKPSDPISTCGTALPDAYQSRYQMVMEEMHRNMERVVTDPDDKINFLRQMIPHHEGAIEMSELILESTDDRRIVNIARGIITEQRNEINIMKYLLRELESDTTNRKQ